MSISEIFCGHLSTNVSDTHKNIFYDMEIICVTRHKTTRKPLIQADFLGNASNAIDVLPIDGRCTRLNDTNTNRTADTTRNHATAASGITSGSECAVTEIVNGGAM